MEISKLGKKGGLALLILGLVLGLGLMLMGGAEEDSGDTSAALPSPDAYRASLEARIADLCGGVSGAGRVQVFVTLAGGYEYVYATDNDGRCLTVGSGTREQAVVEAVRAPEILGVGIVCQGADDPRVSADLARLVASALSVGTNRIVVIPGE